MKKCLHLILLTLALLVVGCSFITEEDVFNLECGTGNLILHETFKRGFGYSPVTFELFYEMDNERRLVCEIWGLYVPYTDPKPDERYMYFRAGDPNGYYPVFVNPNEFSLSEYENIRDTLKRNIAVIDEAVTTRKKDSGPIYESSRQPKISSIRYIDLNSLKYTYTNAESNISLVIKPTGEVAIEDHNKGQSWSSIGFVISDGKSVVIDPDKNGSAYWRHKPIEGLKPFLLSFIREDKKTLFDDFSVKIADDRDEFRKARTIWINRRDAGR